MNIGRFLALQLAKGSKILICSNGGSAADAQRWATEFVNHFLVERPPLLAIALNANISALTAINNDCSFKLIFAKQIQDIGNLMTYSLPYPPPTLASIFSAP
ncbi:hypothetical protein DSUL_20241 [Desulfovibrionales bacterium]